MIEDIHNCLKLYITENGIPLKQVLTEVDLHQLSVTLAHITNSKAKLEFEAISYDIFEGLKDKGLPSIEWSLQQIPFTIEENPNNNIGNIALLGYYCFQYFAIAHDLPIEKILLVVNTYMRNHIIEQDYTHTIDCSNPVSNLISINDTQYVRHNGRTLLPPTIDIKNKFIKHLTSLLIK